MLSETLYRLVTFANCKTDFHGLQILLPAVNTWKSIHYTHCLISNGILYGIISLWKTVFCLLWYPKAGGKLTSYIVLLSWQPNSATDFAIQAGFYSACQLSPQKDYVGIQKKILLWFLLMKIIFFQRHITAMGMSISLWNFWQSNSSVSHVFALWRTLI